MPISPALDEVYRTLSVFDRLWNQDCFLVTDPWSGHHAADLLPFGDQTFFQAFIFHSGRIYSHWHCDISGKGVVRMNMQPSNTGVFL